jgi:hypothetical protein
MTAEEPVGSVAEEAAKLLSAMQDWARRDEDRDRTDEQEHDHAGEECRWCPICHLVRVAKATSPEVRDHLTQAGLSFVLAVKALLEESERPPRPATPVEKIDLSEG